jgi:hypothetical protein
MNRQLLESVKAAVALARPDSDLDEVVIPVATARAIIDRYRIGPQHTCDADGQQKAAIEATPHVVNALTAMWGFHECSNYLRKLMVIDTERDNRKGFSREAFEELVFLYRLIQENRNSLIKEILPRAHLDELEHRERLMRVESAYLRRS